MKWLREKKYRLFVSLVAGLAAVVVVGAVPLAQSENMEMKILRQAGEKECVPLCGWWGTMYPKFCFSGKKGERIKISFWLAKAFDW